MGRGPYSATEPVDDSALDQLYALPLQEFVPARNELAKARRKAGDRINADRIRSLSKPTLSAWLVNQLVRSHPNLVGTLVAALDRVRIAQVGAFDGRADLPSLAESKRDERDAMAELQAAAPRVLAKRGQAASVALVQRALRSLRAAAADPETREILLAGRMTTDHPEAGFDGLAVEPGHPAVPSRPEPDPKTPPAPVAPAVRAPARDTVDFEIKQTQEAAAAKREKEAIARAREEARREREAERMAVTKRIDQVRRNVESARELENRLTRQHREAERAHAEAQRRMEDANRILREAVERLSEMTVQRSQLEAELDELSARRDALRREA